MWCHFSPTLAAKYAARAGDGRQLRYESLSDYEANWAKEQAVLHDADGAEALHKAKCAEVLMLWTHHIPAAKKGELLQVAFPSIPTLKEYSAEHAAHPTAGGVYAEKHSCITGHNNTGRTITNHTFPHWPDEVHYRAYSLSRSRSRPRPRPLSTPHRETVSWICSPGVSPSRVHTHLPLALALSIRRHGPRSLPFLDGTRWLRWERRPDRGVVVTEQGGGKILPLILLPQGVWCENERALL